MRQLIRGVLSALGVRNMNDAIDGSDALAALRNWTPDIIFVDWEMAPMNGLEFTRSIRHHENIQMRVCPIIMVSSYTTVKRITAARDAGINEFIAKPISPKSVYSRIAMTIEKPRDFVQVGEYFGPDRRRKVEDMAGDERRRTEANYVPIASQSLSKKRTNTISEANSKPTDETNNAETGEEAADEPADNTDNEN